MLQKKEKKGEKIGGVLVTAPRTEPNLKEDPEKPKQEGTSACVGRVSTGSSRRPVGQSATHAGTPEREDNKKKKRQKGPPGRPNSNRCSHHRPKATGEAATAANSERGKKKLERKPRRQQPRLSHKGRPPPHGTSPTAPRKPKKGGGSIGTPGVTLAPPLPGPN